MRLAAASVIVLAGTLGAFPLGSSAAHASGVSLTVTPIDVSTLPLGGAVRATASWSDFPPGDLGVFLCRTPTITLDTFIADCDISNLRDQLVNNQPGSGSVSLWLRQNLKNRDCRNRDTCWVVALEPGDPSTVQVANEVSANGPPSSTPTAYAGPDEDVDAGALVALDGSRSTDPEGTPLTFDWEQIDGPVVVLDDRTKLVPRFTAPKLQDGATLTFRLTVTNAYGQSRTDDVTVHVAPK